MRPRSIRPILLLTLVGVIGAGGYAIASGEAGKNLYAPRIACVGRQLITARGTAPTSATTAFLVFPDGASVRTNVDHHRYTFALPAPSPTGTPSLLRFVDDHGRARDTRLQHFALRPCAAKPAARQGAGGLSVGGKAPTLEDQAVTLVNQASTIAFRTSKDCGDQLIPTPKLAISNGAPARRMLDVLGVLRRPPTQEELSYVAHLGRGTPPDDMAVLTIYRRYTRVIHQPGGTTARITVGTGK